MTPEQITETLRIHRLWLQDDPSGKRANLRGANLSDAYLRDAYLRGANLSDAEGIIRVGTATDGYEFFGVKRDGDVWIKAGCRWFTASDARDHWHATRADTPLGRERIRFVDFIEAHFAEETH